MRPDCPAKYKWFPRKNCRHVHVIHIAAPHSNRLVHRVMITNDHITKIRINESAGVPWERLLRNLRLPRATPASQRKLANGFTVRFSCIYTLR